MELEFSKYIPIGLLEIFEFRTIQLEEFRKYIPTALLAAGVTFSMNEFVVPINAIP